MKSFMERRKTMGDKKLTAIEVSREKDLLELEVERLLKRFTERTKIEISSIEEYSYPFEGKVTYTVRVKI